MDLIIIKEHEVVVIRCEDVTVEQIGQKAYGLLGVPPHWRLPFFVFQQRPMETISGPILNKRKEWL